MKAGERYNRLTALRAAGADKHGHPHWMFLCDCGAETRANINMVRAGRTRSCGCLKLEIARRAGDRFRTHGKTNTAEFVAWRSMISRCENAKHKYFSMYGGRGITVCSEWRSSFEAFFSALGSRPSPLHTVDRIDNDGNYEPGNCRWATRKQQARNRRNTLLIEFRGSAVAITEAAELAGVTIAQARYRHSRGLSIEGVGR